MQWFIQNAQILIIGFVVLSSILGPLFKWLGEKRQQLRQENERRPICAASFLPGSSRVT